MQMLLTKENSWKCIVESPPDPVTDAWTRQCQQGYSTIGLSVEDDQLVHLRGETTAKGAWDALNKYHEKSTANSIVRLMKRVMTLRLEEGADLETHIAEISGAFQQLADIGKKSITPEDWQVAVLLGSLPESFDTLVTTLESRQDGELTTAVVQASLMEEWKKRQYKNTSDAAASAALFTKSKPKHKSKARSDVICYHCNEPGHFKQKCPQLRQQFREWRQNKSAEKQHVKMVEGSQPEFLFATTNILKNGWVIDSGSTSHVSSERDLFVKFNAHHNETIFVANGERVPAEGIGTVALNVLNRNGRQVTIWIQNVLFVPSMSGNLLSVRKLIANGYSVIFTPNGSCDISHGDKHVAMGELRDNLYMLKVVTRALAVHEKVHPENCAHQWHRLCGHRDLEVVKRLGINGLVEGIEIADCDIHETCDVCQQGKSTKLPFPKHAEKWTKSAMDLVHTDVCGPMQTATPSKKRYLLTFIDDHTRFTRIYLLERKSDVFSKLVEYVEMAFNLFEKRPKFIRSDRGGEYTGKTVTSFLSMHGIQVHYTAAACPAQNGVAERKNRTLIEMSRCMLIEAGLNYTFWGEAVTMANYIQNRLPWKSVPVTPFEAWFGFKPNISHFRVFGAKCFVHIEKEKRQKLDPTAIEMVLVGYDEHSKAYRCFNPKTHKVIVSRDVKFALSGANQPKTNDSESVVIIQHGQEAEPSVNCHDDDQEQSSKENTQKGSDTEEDFFSVSEDEMQQAQPTRPIRSTRGNRPQYYHEEIHLAKSTASEPRSFNEAISGQFSEQWLNAMKEEIESLNENGTWELTELPNDRKAIGCKWVFKVKKGMDGSIRRFKARLVAQGFSQKYGEDYDQVFAPVATKTTFRILLSIAARDKMEVFHMDAKTAFLNGTIDETIFMRQPPGFVVEGNSKLVCRLLKSLYGLKQSARTWHETLHRALLTAGYIQCREDPCLYYKIFDGDRCYLLVYVDDIVVACKNVAAIRDTERALRSKFKIENLGPIKEYLGMQIGKNADGIFHISQPAYIGKVIAEFNLSDAKPSAVPIGAGYEQNSEESDLLPNGANYQKLIGCLLYVAINTRPDISASISILAQKVSRPTQADWIELKRVVRYLKGSTDLKLLLGKPNDNVPLFGYADANFAEAKIDRKSNSGHIFFVFGAAVSWSCRKQTCVALSSCEAEFVSLSDACKEAVWLRRLLEEFDLDIKEPTLICEDNQSCLKLIEEENLTRRSRHIDTRRFYVKEHIVNGTIRCEYCSSENMLADMLTKSLPAPKLEKFRNGIGLNII